MSRFADRLTEGGHIPVDTPVIKNMSHVERFQAREAIIQKVLGTVDAILGQGGLLEQFDKRLRKFQRKVTFDLLEARR